MSPAGYTKGAEASCKRLLKEKRHKVGGMVGVGLGRIRGEVGGEYGQNTLFELLK